MPLHKLSQWLAYSLIEPLQRAGIAVTDIDGLTGLAEYRNGGLFIDTGTLVLRNSDAARRRHAVDLTLVVEWRALTVALLDRLADLVRQRLRRNAAELPLGMILQGGTWARQAVPSHGGCGPTARRRSRSRAMQPCSGRATQKNEGNGHGRRNDR